MFSVKCECDLGKKRKHIFQTKARKMLIFSRLLEDTRILRCRKLQKNRIETCFFSGSKCLFSVNSFFVLQKSFFPNQSSKEGYHWHFHRLWKPFGSQDAENSRKSLQHLSFCQHVNLRLLATVFKSNVILVRKKRIFQTKARRMLKFVRLLRHAEIKLQKISKESHKNRLFSSLFNVNL